MSQFDRIYKITIGPQGGKGVVLEGKPHSNGLQISFDISKDLTEKTNKCSLKITNLSNNTIKIIEQEKNVCIIEVGYSEDIGLRRIFVGDVVNCITKRDSKGFETSLELRDGQRAIRDCVVSLSYAEGVSAKKFIDDIATEMGLIVFYEEGLEFPSFDNGFSFIGAGRTALEKACSLSNTSYSIQNNVIQIIKQGSNNKNKALLLKYDSGLIGYPERIVKDATKTDKKDNSTINKDKEKKAGWRIRCLLQPTLSPGDLVKIDSVVINGWFKIESMKHTGSYMDADWYSELEVYEIKGE